MIPHDPPFYIQPGFFLCLCRRNLTLFFPIFSLATSSTLWLARVTLTQSNTRKQAHSFNVLRGFRGTRARRHLGCRAAIRRTLRLKLRTDSEKLFTERLRLGTFPSFFSFFFRCGEVKDTVSSRDAAKRAHRVVPEAVRISSVDDNHTRDVLAYPLPFLSPQRARSCIRAFVQSCVHVSLSSTITPRYCGK